MTKEYADTLIGAVHEAGRRLLRTWPGLAADDGSSAVQAEVKADGSLVTEADRDCEAILVGVLMQAVPDAVVVSEEDEQSHGREAETVWFIDPLDGTRQYLAGSPDFAVLVSAWTSGVPAWSAMSFPVDGLLGIADEVGIDITPMPSRPPRRLVHAVYCDPPGLRERLPSDVGYAVDRFESTRAMFDVASGQAAGAVILMCGHQAWDIAAPIHLISAAGGIVTDELGRTVHLRGHVVAARYLIAADQPDLHKLLLSCVPDVPELPSPQPQAAESDFAMSSTFLTPVANDWADRFFDEGFEPTFRALGKYESTTEDLDNLLRLLQLDAGSRILDVPCGFGRHAGLLAERGYSVVGIDASEHQIALARSRWPGVTFDVSDMRNPPNGPFDAVLNLWTSFGYLESTEEDMRALVSWRDCLAPGGSLVLELTTLERAEFENRQSDEAVSTKRVVRNGVQEDAWYDWESQLSNVRYSRPGWSRECRARMYSREQLAAALAEAGFVDIRMMGDFRGGPLAPANRTVIIAQAPNNSTEGASE